MITSLSIIKKELLKNKLDAMLISSASNIIYLTAYSGFSKDEREAYLLIVAQPQAQPQGLTHKTPGVLGYILTDGRYTEAVRKLIPDFKLMEISSEFSAGDAIKQLAEKYNIKRLGFEGHNISFLEHRKLLQRFNDSNHCTVDALRIIKASDEISNIEKACRLGDKTFDYILKKIKLGVSEKELAFEIEFFIKKNGADISFRPIVAFGPNSALPHHTPTNNQLTNNQIVLLDFGVKLNNYCSDMTRTVFFGKPTNAQEKMYQAVLEAQILAVEFLNKNRHSGKRSASRIGFWTSQNDIVIKASEVDRIARDYIISKGYPTIPHSVGHGIGIDVHEAPHLSPKSKDILKEGMVFSIEPGIYLSNFGGVRIEDLVVLEKSGPRLLTHSPRKLTVLQ